jgi:16S rRNA processing protein RimM
VTEEPDFVLIGLVRRPHGIAGEIGVEPVSAVRERYEHLKHVLVKGEDGIRQMEVESIRSKGELLLFKLQGIDDRNSAQALAQAELGVKREDVWPLPEGSYYIFDLVGCTVTGEGGRRIGVVQDVVGLPANDVLVVRTDKGEALVPVTRNVVKQVDLAAKTIVIEELEGLLD